MSRLRRLLHPVYKRLETTVHPLRYLFIEITQRCDLNCRHCGSDCGRETQVDELSTEEWLAFFDYLPKHMQTDKLLLVVTGGEPLCHPELDRVLEGISRNKLTWGMVTNAWSLNAKTMQRLLTHGISTVTVSLDGLQKNHDWLRGRRHSFERALRGIGLLTQAQLPFFDVVTCVNPRNLEELPRVLALLKKLGVPQWRLFSIFPKGRARQNRELIMEGAQFARMLTFIREARADPDNRDISIQFSCEGYLPPELDRAVRDEPYFCRAGISIGSVLADGAISACPNISRELVQGNVRTDDFAQVWENRYAQYRDRSWMKVGMCSECEHFSGCKGNSLHLWDDQTHQTGLCSMHHLNETEAPDDE